MSSILDKIKIIFRHPVINENSEESKTAVSPLARSPLASTSSNQQQPRANMPDDNDDDDDELEM